MIKLLTLFFLLPFTLLAQNKQNKIYGNIATALDLSSNNTGIGASGNIGFHIISSLGVGLNIELYHLGPNKGSALGTFETKYFFSAKKIKPFIALQGGFPIWSQNSYTTNFTTSTLIDNTGKYCYGAEIGGWYSKFAKQKGIMLAFGLKNIAYNYITEITPNTGVYYNNKTSNFTNIAHFQIKVGYKF